MSIIETTWQLANQTLFIFIGIMGIGFLIAFHELGHFITIVCIVRTFILG